MVPNEYIPSLGITNSKQSRTHKNEVQLAFPFIVTLVWGFSIDCVCLDLLHAIVGWMQG